MATARLHERVLERPKSWRCCGLRLAGYLVRCPECGTRRVLKGCFRIHSEQLESSGSA